jgi:hypothetical protein
VTAPDTACTRTRDVLIRNADVQYLLGAHEDQVFRIVGYDVEAQTVGLPEEQRCRRARNTPARMPHASNDAVEVTRDEDSYRSERLVHLDPQDIIVRVGTFLLTQASEIRKKKKKRGKGTSQQRKPSLVELDR